MSRGSLDLGDNDVHVWIAEACGPATMEATYFATLDERERKRAAALANESDRRPFVIAHGLLRALLAGYTGIAASAVRFRRSPAGKPHLEPPAGIAFNLSSSGDRIAIAIARHAVGIDIEVWKPFAHERVAARMFSPAERRAFAAVPPHRQCAAFFAVWTRKEAYVKATGDGIATGLEHFDVSVDLAHAELLGDRRDECATNRWGMHALPAGAGYSAALVTRRGASVSHYDLRGYVQTRRLVLAPAAVR